MLTLDVAISTYKPEGILRVEKMLKPLKKKDRIRYIISWQEHENAEIPESLAVRNDVEVYRLDIKGLSNNRNNAIDHCTGDIVLIADDDLEYYPDFSQKILNTYEENPFIDLATFKGLFLSEKKYPSEFVKLKLPLPRYYYVTSMEISFRRKSITDLRFFPELGLGSKEMYCGEEELFLISAIKRNLNCYFSPIILFKHSEITTGERISKEILRAQGFIIKILYPYNFLIRNFLKAYRINKQKKAGFFFSLKYLCIGSLKSKKILKNAEKCFHW